MNTGTAATRATAREAWEPVLRGAGAQAQEIGEQVLAAAHTIASQGLRGPLTDPGRSGQHKADLVARVFAGQVDERVTELLQGMVRGRWSRPVDLVSALHDLGIEAVLAGARAAGTLDDVESEVFAVSQLLDKDRELRLALEPSRRSTTEARAALARRVVGPRVSPQAMALVEWCVRHQPESPAGGVPANLRRVCELAAAMQERTIADVVSAIPLTSAQQARLARLLEQRLGGAVELNLVVDPEVLGGLRVTVRDHVIDSTVRTSLAGARAQLVG